MENAIDECITIFPGLVDLAEEFWNVMAKYLNSVVGKIEDVDKFFKDTLYGPVCLLHINKENSYYGTLVLVLYIGRHPKSQKYGFGYLPQCKHFEEELHKGLLYVGDNSDPQLYNGDGVLTEEDFDFLKLILHQKYDGIEFYYLFVGVEDIAKELIDKINGLRPSYYKEDKENTTSPTNITLNLDSSEKTYKYKGNITFEVVFLKNKMLGHWDEDVKYIDSNISIAKNNDIWLPYNNDGKLNFGDLYMLNRIIQSPQNYYEQVYGRERYFKHPYCIYHEVQFK